MSIFFENPALRNFWYMVASEREIANGPVGRILLGENIVIYRDPNDKIVVAPNRCPHREGILSNGNVKDGILTCPYHGWSFGADGECVLVPSAASDFPIPGNAHLGCAIATARYGLVWVCLGENPPPMPNIIQDDDPNFRRINNPVEVWNSSATRMADNFMDIAHFPCEHAGTFGDNQQTFVPDIELEQLDEDFYGYGYEVTTDDRPESGFSGERFTRRMTTGFNLPFITRSTISYPEGLDHILLLVNSPIDDLRTYFTFIVWRNDDFSISAEELMMFDRRIGVEDKTMLESIPGVLPLEPRALAHTQADKPSAAWRHAFVRLLDGEPAATLVSGA